jgi:hypothetical protein
MKAIRSTVYLLFLTGVLSTATAVQDVTTDPDLVRLEVEDIRRLANVLRLLERGGDTLGALEREYLGHASPALRAYAERYRVNTFDPGGSYPEPSRKLYVAR